MNKARVATKARVMDLHGVKVGLEFLSDSTGVTERWLKDQRVVRGRQGLENAAHSVGKEQQHSGEMRSEAWVAMKQVVNWQY